MPRTPEEPQGNPPSREQQPSSAPVPVVNSATLPAQRTISDWVMDHPKLAGFLGLIALAITFSPRASVMGTWVCLVIAEVFAIAMFAGFAREYHVPYPRVVICGGGILTSLFVLVFGLWLTDIKGVSAYETSIPPPALNSRIPPPPAIAFDKSPPTSDGRDNIDIQDKLDATVKRAPAIKAEVRRASREPLEVIAFTSMHTLTLSNRSDENIYVIDMQIKQELEDKYLALGFEVAPHRTASSHVLWNSPDLYESIPKLADTWRGNYAKAASQFGSGCLMFVYFSANDSGLAMLRENYRSQRGELGEASVSGEIRYRLSGADTKTETIPVAATLMRKQRGCK